MWIVSWGRRCGPTVILTAYPPPSPPILHRPSLTAASPTPVRSEEGVQSEALVDVGILDSMRMEVWRLLEGEAGGAILQPPT